MGAGIMLLKGKKVLILKRKNYKDDKHSDKWDFPGGSSDKGESRLETAIRECLEETRITKEEYAIFDHVEFKYYTLFIASVDTELVPILSSEHSSWAWVDIEKIKSLESKIHPKDFKPFLVFYKYITS